MKKTASRLLLSFLVALISFNSNASQHSICSDVSDLPWLKDHHVRATETIARQSLGPSLKNAKILDMIMEKHSDFEAIQTSTVPSRIKLMISGGTRPSSLLTKGNHKIYAKYQGFRYRFVYPIEFKKELIGKQLYWMKVYALLYAMGCDDIKDGDWIAWIDDDIVIDDFHSGESMLDMYIDYLAGGNSILVTNDNDKEKMNTGILLIQKNMVTTSFLHMWSLYSHDPIKGYESQESTLHEQQALKELLENSQFKAINDAT